MCSGITWPPSGTRAASNRSEIIAPIYDDDGEIDDILAVNINGEIIEDEEAAMESSDWTCVTGTVLLTQWCCQENRPHDTRYYWNRPGSVS